MKKTILFLALGFLLTGQTLFAQVPSYVPTNGLVGYWPFNGNANDESGNGNNGTVNGAVLTSDRNGSSNSAYLFNGTTDYINILASNSLNFETNNKFSISYWVKAQSLSTSQLSIVLNKQTSLGSTQDGWNSNIETNNKCTLRIQNGTSTSSCTFNSGSTLISPSIYYHVVQIFDNGTYKIYINNASVSQGSCAALIGDNTSNMFIGKPIWTAPNAKGTNGIIDDIAIYNRALTDQEVTNLYNSANTNECLTMVINTGDLSTTPVTYTSSVSIYPNPANDQITIDCGNLANVTGWSIKITNMLGQEVFNQPMNTQQYVVPLNTWSGQGMYFVKIINAQNEVVNIKKIILQ